MRGASRALECGGEQPPLFVLSSPEPRDGNDRVDRTHSVLARPKSGGCSPPHSKAASPHQDNANLEGGLSHLSGIIRAGPMKQRNDNFRGGLVMLVAVGSLSAMDACLKALSAVYPPLQVSALRALASLPLICIWIAFSGGFGALLHVRFSLHLVRGVLGVFMLSAFVYGVRNLPLSTAYTIFFVAPLLITTLAAIVLRERVEWQRWVAIVIGLSGVLFVLRPEGTGVVSRPALAVLLAAIAYAVSAISVRVLGRTDSTQSMVFWLMAFIAGGATLLAIPEWIPVRHEHWPVLAGLALAGFVGQWALTEAFRIGESSFIAPFEYTALAWGVTLDWLFWRTVPTRHTFAVAALIIACGIYLVRRERSRGSDADAHPHAIGADAAVD